MRGYARPAKCDIPADTPSLSAGKSRFEAVFCDIPAEPNPTSAEISHLKAESRDIPAETGLTSAGKSHFDAIATVIQRSYEFGGG